VERREVEEAGRHGTQLGAGIEAMNPEAADGLPEEIISLHQDLTFQKIKL